MIIFQYINKICPDIADFSFDRFLFACALKYDLDTAAFETEQLEGKIAIQTGKVEAEIRYAETKR